MVILVDAKFFVLVLTCIYNILAIVFSQLEAAGSVEIKVIKMVN